MRMFSSLLLPLLIEAALSTLIPATSSRLLQASTPISSLVIPQALVSNIVYSSMTLVANLYSQLLQGYNLTKVEPLQSSTYQLTYTNGDITYLATTSAYPNNTVNLVNFKQVGWNAVSPYNTSQPVTTCDMVAKRIYQIETASPIGINHTFANNIHNYSLRYLTNRGVYNILVSFSVSDNSTRLYDFSASEYQNPLFRQLPLNFSVLDGNLKSAFRCLSDYNGTAGFVYTNSTYVSFIANSVAGNGTAIVYYVNLITDGDTLEALLSFSLPSSPQLIFLKLWQKNPSSNPYLDVNIINAWEDPEFVKAYSSAIATNETFRFINQIQGSSQDSTIRRIVFAQKDGSSATISY